MSTYRLLLSCAAFLFLFEGVVSAEDKVQAVIAVKPGSVGEFKGSTGSGQGSKGVPKAITDVVNGGFLGSHSADILRRVGPDRAIRGAKEAQLYRRFAPSVVLVFTKDGLGTGTLISASGEILTNYHVVKGFKDVGVVFKPSSEGRKLSNADVVQASVVKVDQIADLALIKVRKIPQGVTPFAIATEAEISVGDDVHAIGHPTGESWSYTKGVVSQIRQEYEWKTDQGIIHKANVIQTQTPISPGNSGGPLLTSAGKLVGINSFKAGGEGLNFAVASSEVIRFLNSSTDRLATSTPPPSANNRSEVSTCDIKELYRGSSKDDTMEIVGYDTDCDGKAEGEIRTPYDIRKPIQLVLDNNKDGVFDQIIFDFQRKGKWSYSLQDVNFDGTWDLECDHEDGGVRPTRCIPYKLPQK